MLQRRPYYPRAKLQSRPRLMHGVAPQCAVKVAVPSLGGEAGGRSLGFISLIPPRSRVALEIGAPVICQQSRAAGSCDQPVDPKLPGRMTIFYRPVDRFSLRFEGGKDVVAVIFDYVIFDRRTLRPTLGPGLNINVRHCSSPWIPFVAAGRHSDFGPKWRRTISDAI
jgi:hypothetical protein